MGEGVGGEKDKECKGAGLRKQHKERRGRKRKEGRKEKERAKQLKGNRRRV